MVGGVHRAPDQSRRHPGRALIAAGRIGTVRHVLGLGPHRLGAERPDWFWDPARSGPMLADLASHQIHHAARLLGTAELAVTMARTTPAPEREHPDQIGELTLDGGTGSAYVRVDWLTPDGFPTWGDVRLFVTGDTGTIEVRTTDVLPPSAAAPTPRTPPPSNRSRRWPIRWSSSTATASSGSTAGTIR
ncbi:MAG: Gfo/Idh/MocA family oxidoreductase [Acidimicrobiales bacterium]